MTGNDMNKIFDRYYGNKRIVNEAVPGFTPPTAMGSGTPPTTSNIPKLPIGQQQSQTGVNQMASLEQKFDQMLNVLNSINTLLAKAVTDGTNRVAPTAPVAPNTPSRIKV